MKIFLLLVIVGCIIFDAEALGKCKADFVDSLGDDCKKYVDEKWCKPNGDYGENWKEDWGPFSKYEKDGYDATDCPECGCGMPKTCGEGECWCVNNGGRTCLKPEWFTLTYCDKDECWDKSECYERGYWCDDSQLSTSEDLELVDCSKYYLTKTTLRLSYDHSDTTSSYDHSDVKEAGFHEYYDYVYLGLKTYINCMQAQTVKMQSKIVEDSKMMKEMQSKIVEDSKMMKKMQSQIEKLPKEQV